MIDHRTLAHPLAAFRSGRNAMALVAAGLVIAAVSLMLLVLGVLPSHDSSPLPSTVPATEETEDLGAVQESEGDTLATVIPLVTQEIFLARDPFDPVVPAPVEAAPEDTDPSAPEGTDPSAPVDPSQSGSPVLPVPRTPGDDPCEGQQEVVCDGQVVTLLDLVKDLEGQDVAVIQAGSLVYEVRVGDTFATYFQVRSIEPPCVRLQYGDEGFQLCLGKAVMK